MAHAHQDAAGRAVNVVVLHAEDRTGVRDLVVLHVDGMATFAGARVVDLAVLERERSGVVVGAQAPVRRAARSAEGLVGKECGSTCRSGWSPSHQKKNRIKDNKKH